MFGEEAVDSSDDDLDIMKADSGRFLPAACRLPSSFSQHRGCSMLFLVEEMNQAAMMRHRLGGKPPEKV